MPITATAVAWMTASAVVSLGAGAVASLAATGVALMTAAPAFAQVTVDLHALQALPDHPAASRPARPAAPPATLPPAALSPATNAPVAARDRTVPPAPQAASAAPPAVSAAPPAVSAATPTSPAAKQPAAPAAQPALPENVPQTASIAAIAPPLPTVGSKPPPPAAGSPATAAAPTAAGLRVTFAPGESGLSPDSVASIRELTAATPPNDATTFNVLAYAPGKPDDPSTARRVSLSRAMAVRGALVADGVPSARIFVRALGEQYGDGPPDRVDVNVAGPNAPASAAAGPVAATGSAPAAAR